MQYRNTPLPDMKLSPSQILFHRQQRDHLPSHPTNYKLHEDWLKLANQREELLSARNTKLTDSYNSKTYPLPSLSIGTTVRVQNQGLKNHNQWLKTGKIVDVLPNRQYQVRIDGSGRITKRNRRFLKPYVHQKSETNFPIPSSLPPMQMVDNPMPHPQSMPIAVPPPPPPTQPDVPSVTPPPPPIDVQPAPTPTTRPSRIPRALKNLQSFNKPGLLDQPPLPRR